MQSAVEECSYLDDTQARVDRSTVHGYDPYTDIGWDRRDYTFWPSSSQGSPTSSPRARVDAGATLTTLSPSFPTSSCLCSQSHLRNLQEVAIGRVAEASAQFRVIVAGKQQAFHTQIDPGLVGPRRPSQDTIGSCTTPHAIEQYRRRLQ